MPTLADLLAKMRLVPNGQHEIPDQPAVIVATDAAPDRPAIEDVLPDVVCFVCGCYWPCPHKPRHLNGPDRTDDDEDGAGIWIDRENNKRNSRGRIVRPAENRAARKHRSALAYGIVPPETEADAQAVYGTAASDDAHARLLSCLWRMTAQVHDWGLDAMDTKTAALRDEALELLKAYRWL